MPDGTDIETLLPLSQRQRRPAGTNLFGFKDFSYICSDGLYLPAHLPALPEQFLLPAFLFAQRRFLRFQRFHGGERGVCKLVLQKAGGFPIHESAESAKGGACQAKKPAERNPPAERDGAQADGDHSEECR